MCAYLSGLLNHAAAGTATADAAVLDHVARDLQLVPGLVPVVDVAEHWAAEGRNAGAHLALPRHLLLDGSLRAGREEAHAQRQAHFVTATAQAVLPLPTLRYQPLVRH